MSSSSSQTVSADLTATRAALISRAFRERLAQRVRASLSEVTERTEGDATVVTARFGIDSSALPSAASRFVPKNVEVLWTETWNGPNATIAFDLGSIPAAVNGTVTLTGDAPTTITIEADVTSTKAIIGAAVVAAAKPFLGKVLDVYLQSARLELEG